MIRYFLTQLPYISVMLMHPPLISVFLILNRSLLSVFSSAFKHSPLMRVEKASLGCLILEIIYMNLGIFKAQRLDEFAFIQADANHTSPRDLGWFYKR